MSNVMKSVLKRIAITPILVLGVLICLCLFPVALVADLMLYMSTKLVELLNYVFTQFKNFMVFVAKL
jgi:hypothetical protein